MKKGDLVESSGSTGSTHGEERVDGSLLAIDGPYAAIWSGGQIRIRKVTHLRVKK